MGLQYAYNSYSNLAKYRIYYPNLIFSKIPKTNLVLKIYRVPNSVQKISSIAAVWSLLLAKQYMGYQGSIISTKHFITETFYYKCKNDFKNIEHVYEM